MQVRPGGPPGPADGAQRLPRLHDLPRPDIEILHVGVERLLPVRVGDPHTIAVAAAPAGRSDDPAHCRQHPAALRAGKVDSPVKGFLPGKGVIPPAVGVGDPPRIGLQRKAQRLRRDGPAQGSPFRRIFLRPHRQDRPGQQHRQQRRA